MIPSFIYICGLRFEIRLKAVGFCHGSLGFTSAKDAWIELNTKECQSEDYLREVLLHEIIHGIDRLSLEPGITEALRRLPTATSNTRLHEPEVLVFSRGLWITLTDPRNIEAIKWIFDWRNCQTGFIFLGQENR